MGIETANHAPEGDAGRRLQELTARLPPLEPAQEDAARQWLASLIGEWATFREALRRHGEELEASLQQAQFYRLRYQELFEFAPEGYLVTDTQGVIREANYAAAELLQTRKEFLVGKPFGFIVQPRQRQDFYARLQTLAHRPDSPDRWEVTLHRPGCAARTVEAMVTSSPFSEDHPVIFRWLLRDVTAQRKAEQALRAERTFTGAVLQTAPVLILVLDKRGRILRTNAFCGVVSGYAEAELTGRSWCELLSPGPEQDAGRLMLEYAQAGGMGSSRVLPLRTRDGQGRTISWDARALDFPLDGVEALLVIGHDITELQQAQQHTLQRERLAAIGEMTTGLAHESRNALQRSRACLERLRWRLDEQPDALNLLTRAQQAQDDIVRLLDDVRSYAAPVVPAFQPCDLAAVWREAWAQVRSLAPGREARLEEDTGELDLVCTIDRYRLTQVFRNILENAAAAVHGPLRVDILCRADAVRGREAVRVAVRDNGPGLDAEQRRRIFEPFFTTKAKGTGLGMPIARRIVEAQGGQIAVGTYGPPGAEIVLLIPYDGP
jgi:PAS domain S-box-containing protein